MMGPVDRAAIQCQICYEPSTMYSALDCGHPFCNECYTTFIEHKIADEGHACIHARCPETKVPLPANCRSRSAPPTRVLVRRHVSGELDSARLPSRHRTVAAA